MKKKKNENETELFYSRPLKTCYRNQRKSKRLSFSFPFTLCMKTKTTVTRITTRNPFWSFTRYKKRKEEREKHLKTKGLRDLLSNNKTTHNIIMMIIIGSSFRLKGEKRQYIFDKITNNTYKVYDECYEEAFEVYVMYAQKACISEFPSIHESKQG